MNESREITLQNIRKRTSEDLIKCLQEHGECILIRPTGFGKTWLLTNLIQSGIYTNILYLYPAEVIRNTVVNKFYNDKIEEIKNREMTDISDEECSEGYDIETCETLKSLSEIDGVTLMTYSKLSRLSNTDFEEMEYDLIILDECHRIGGRKTKRAVSRLQATNPMAHYVGATATPNRTDAFDVAHTFFHDRTVFEYNAHNAFTDGFLLRPYYCYCAYDIDKDIKNAFKEAFTAGEMYLKSDEFDDIQVKEVIKKTILENANIVNMENVIKNTCEKYLDDSNYMKFIVFFSNQAHLKSKLPVVKNWFKKAYPNHKIKDLIITSDSKYACNVDNLDDLHYENGVIDLICCIDMLNMGYHVNDLSGIMMYRGTESGIIFSQQLGRALSSGAEKPCIVFDVVDNIHRKAVYDITLQDNKKSTKKVKNTTVSMGWHVNENGLIVDDNDDLAPLYIKEGRIYSTLNDEETDFIIDANGNIIDDTNYEVPSWKQNSNTIGAEDMIATEHEASYKELIAKLVAEPMSQRCRQAVELHFRNWCRKSNEDFPFTDEQLDEMHQLDRKEWYKKFKESIKENGFNYPLGDANKLLEIGESKDDGKVPLRLFARLKSVQINQILELLEELGPLNP